MSTVHTSVWNLLCGEILISCFVLITWHEDRACRAENCFVFPKLFMANFRSLMKIRRNIALCFGEITRGASENLPEFDEISCEQLTKVSDFRFHYFCTTLCLYLHQKYYKLYPTMKCQQADYCLGKQFHRSLKLVAYCYKFQVFITICFINRYFSAIIKRR